MANSFFPMPTPGSTPIIATVVFAQNKPGAIVSIQPLAAPTTFVMKAGLIETADGRELVLPDEATRARLFQAFGNDPSSVFVVEVGPMGFVADHAIAVEGKA